MHVQNVQNYCFSLLNMQIIVAFVVVVAQAPYYFLPVLKFSRLQW